MMCDSVCLPSRVLTWAEPVQWLQHYAVSPFVTQSIVMHSLYGSQLASGVTAAMG